jgi:autoinducer 2-degrading protein
MLDVAYRIVASPEAADDIAAALVTNARASRDEPGVRRFEVMRSRADPAVFLVIETYLDEDALTAHRQTPHYLAWKAASSDGRVVSSERFDGVDMASFE